MSTHVTQQLFRFRVEFQGHPEMEVPVTLYAFHADGRLLASAQVKEGAVELPLKEREAVTAHLLIAPTLTHDEKPTLKLIERMTPYKPVWNIKAGQLEYNLLPVPEIIANCWMGIPVRVLGQVVVEVPYNGSLVPVPVKDARVTVFEVDPIIRFFHTIPISELLTLRERLINALRTVPRPQIDRLLPNLPITTIDPVESVAKMPPQLFRNWLTEAVYTLPNRIDLIRTILPFITLDRQQVLELTTDAQGQFDGTFRFWPFSMGPRNQLKIDVKPDLYFKVDYDIGGVMTTVFETDGMLDTIWNYDGQPVTIRVEYPLPVYPQPSFLRGKEVCVLTLGNYVNVAEMRDGLTKNGEPLAGVVEPHVIFGEDLANQEALYRWSYRKRDTEDPWRVIETPVNRHYITTDTNGKVIVKGLTLGPIAIPGKGKFFRVQPIHPPEGRWAPEADARANTASAFFRTMDLMGGDVARAAGLYDLKLEIFDRKGDSVEANFQMPMADRPIHLEHLVNLRPQLPGVERILDTRVPWLDKKPQATAFQMPIFIDNNPCVARILDTTVNGQHAGPCGFITYEGAENTEALVGFRAYHPNGFATFRFDMARGRELIERLYDSVPLQTAQIEVENPTNLPVTAQGHTMTRLPDHIYQVQPHGIFTTRLRAADLLGNCERAVFTESLHVWATATDGWNRQSQLDSGALPIGFALEPLQRDR